MAFNGSGVYNLVMDWVADAASGIKIRADRHMTQDQDFANALSNTICRDGQSTVIANLPMNSKRITGLADPVNPQDAVTQAWVGANVTGGALIADAPPAGGKVGNLWWDSDQGNLYLRYDDGTSTQWVQVNVASPSQPIIDSGVFKISSGVTSAALANVDIAVPTSGYQGFELWFNNLGALAYSSTGMRFSWDGGATFPSASNQYYYINDNMTNAANGGFVGGGGTGALHVIHSANQLNTSARVSGRMWWSLPDAAEAVQIFSEASGYDQTNAVYRRTRSWGQAALVVGPPNFLRLLQPGATIAAGMKWQLNGIK